MVSQLKSNIYSLEDLLRLSRHTIQTLQVKLNDVETLTQQKLAAQESQLKHLLKSLQDANTLMAEAGMQTGVSIGTGSTGNGIGGGGHTYTGEYPAVDKEKIRRMIEQTRIEGTKMQERYGNQASTPPVKADPALTKDLEKLNGYQYTGTGTGTGSGGGTETGAVEKPITRPERRRHGSYKDLSIDVDAGKCPCVN